MRQRVSIILAGLRPDRGAGGDHLACVKQWDEQRIEGRDTIWLVCIVWPCLVLYHDIGEIY